METGEAGPPGTVLMSGRGRLRSVDGQAGQSTMPVAEGYAGAPGERTKLIANHSHLSAMDMPGLARGVTLRSVALYQPPFSLSWTPIIATAVGNGLTAEMICEWAFAASSWLQK